MWLVACVTGVVVTADEGIRELYSGSYARLVGMCTLVAGDRQEAEEVVQEAFARLLPQWDRVSTYDAPEAWVRGVALRLLSNRLRQLRNGRLAAARYGAAQAISPPSEEPVDIGRALMSLSVPLRQVVVLHYLIGLDVKAVAAELRIPDGTVKSRLSKARSLLEPLLKEDSHAGPP
jgi:RNA polymerase sigma-70 factor (ECF subfamily)